MPDTHTTIRRASQAEAIVDVTMDPMVGWSINRLDMRPGRVARAARMPWGEPGPSIDGGESLWRLRVGEGDGLPAYVSVGVGEPCVLCSVTQAPDAPEALVAEIRGKLLGV